MEKEGLTMKNFKELKVWQKGIELVSLVYTITTIQDDKFNKLSPKVEELSEMLSSFYSKINSNSPTR
ncbi:MAG: hypothetical protein U9N01_01005 [Euryarchaeota archaeon]|nr:hypothetical protein [Euryarchaeota archaeon]